MITILLGFDICYIPVPKVFSRNNLHLWKIKIFYIFSNYNYIYFLKQHNILSHLQSHVFFCSPNFFNLRNRVFGNFKIFIGKFLCLINNTSSKLKVTFASIILDFKIKKTYLLQERKVFTYNFRHSAKVWQY